MGRAGGRHLSHPSTESEVSIQDQETSAVIGEERGSDNQEAADRQDASMSPELGRARGRRLSHSWTDSEQEDPQELHNASVQESNTYGHDTGQNSTINEDDDGVALQQSVDNRGLDVESDVYQPESLISTETPQLAFEQSAQTNTGFPQIDATGSQQEEHLLKKADKDTLGITEISAQRKSALTSMIRERSQLETEISELEEALERTQYERRLKEAAIIRFQAAITEFEGKISNHPPTSGAVSQISEIRAYDNILTTALDRLRGDKENYETQQGQNELEHESLCLQIEEDERKKDSLEESLTTLKSQIQSYVAETKEVLEAEQIAFTDRMNRRISEFARIKTSLWAEFDALLSQATVAKEDFALTRSNPSSKQ